MGHVFQRAIHERSASILAGLPNAEEEAAWGGVMGGEGVKRNRAWRRRRRQGKAARGRRRQLKGGGGRVISEETGGGKRR